MVQSNKKRDRVQQVSLSKKGQPLTPSELLEDEGTYDIQVEEMEQVIVTEEVVTPVVKPVLVTTHDTPTLKSDSVASDLGVPSSSDESIRLAYKDSIFAYENVMGAGKAVKKDIIIKQQLRLLKTFHNVLETNDLDQLLTAFHAVLDTIDEYRDSSFSNSRLLRYLTGDTTISKSKGNEMIAIFTFFKHLSSRKDRLHKLRNLNPQKVCELIKSEEHTKGLLRIIRKYAIG